MNFLGKPVGAVVFDMDGLLLDTERLSMRAWQAGAREQGIEVPDALFFEMIGRREADCIAILEREYGTAIDGPRVATAGQKIYQALLEQGVPVMKGARELLEFLSVAQVPLAVATSTHHAIACDKLQKAGVFDFFQTVTGGDQVKNGKPAPDIYLAAVASLKRVPSDCVAFEDSSPGAMAAATAGVRAVLVPDLTVPSAAALAVASCVCASLIDAKALFASTSDFFECQ